MGGANSTNIKENLNRVSVFQKNDKYFVVYAISQQERPYDDICSDIKKMFKFKDSYNFYKLPLSEKYDKNDFNASHVVFGITETHHYSVNAATVGYKLFNRLVEYADNYLADHYEKTKTFARRQIFKEYNSSMHIGRTFVDNAYEYFTKYILNFVKGYKILCQMINSKSYNPQVEKLIKPYIVVHYDGPVPDTITDVTSANFSEIKKLIELIKKEQPDFQVTEVTDFGELYNIIVKIFSGNRKESDAAIDQLFEYDKDKYWKELLNIFSVYMKTFNPINALLNKYYMNSNELKKINSLFMIASSQHIEEKFKEYGWNEIYSQDYTMIKNAEGEGKSDFDINKLATELNGKLNLKLKTGGDPFVLPDNVLYAVIIVLILLIIYLLYQYFNKPDHGGRHDSFYDVRYDDNYYINNLY